jgi:general secretion pathway protein K
VELVIRDESAKIQVNALVKNQNRNVFDPKQKALWIRFLALAPSNETAVSDGRPEDIVNAIKDWIDTADGDAITGLNGAESSYYQSLPFAYACPNGPIRHIDEMRAIRWITPEIFEGRGDMPGIAANVTVYGRQKTEHGSHFDGRININTADRAVLSALMPAGLEDLADAIVAYREALAPAESGFELADPEWYRQAPGCAALDLDAALITTHSAFFRLNCTATLFKRRLTLEAVVERSLEDGVWHCRTLSLVRGMSGVGAKQEVYG